MDPGGAECAAWTEAARQRGMDGRSTRSDPILTLEDQNRCLAVRMSSGIVLRQRIRIGGPSVEQTGL